jgi:L-lysine exporter family protein LysE/ArgO
MQARQEVEQGLRRTLALTLAVTLLNPHVYLDTVVLMGSVSGRFPGAARYLFGLGAFAASTTWFLALSLGGQVLAPLFSRDLTWRILDGAVCLTMWSIAASLLRPVLFA